MYFLRRFRHFSARNVKGEAISSYFKENAQFILTTATLFAGFFTAGVYSVQNAAAMKVLKGETAATIKVLEKETAATIKVLEKENTAAIKVLEEKLKVTEEKIKTAKEEAKKEALERLFNLVNQAEYESSKKALQTFPLAKDHVK